MSWREAWNLVGVLAGDPSSQVGAAMAGWESARSAEWLLLADLYDLQHQSKAKRTPKPYPRPKVAKPVKKVPGAKPVGDARATLRRLAGGAFSPAPKPDLKGPLRGPNGRFIKRPA